MTKITLYTNLACPWSHRAHIALAELGLEFEPVFIDLSKPREPWYLEINPRGLVPVLRYGDHLLIESGIITQFLADLKESHLLPASGSVEGALTRARINFFVDTFISKATDPLIASIRAADEGERITKANQFVDVIEKEICPLLADAVPFFGGSKELTLAEVNVASFVIRTYAFGKPEAGFLPEFVLQKLRANKTWNKWVEALVAKESVTSIWDEGYNIKMMKENWASIKQ